MQSYIKILLLLTFLYSQMLGNDTNKKIVMGSYPTQESADKDLKKVLEYLQDSKSIVELEKEHQFYFVARKSGKLFITLVEPFANEQVAKNLLDAIKELKPSAYINRLDPKYLSIKNYPDKIQRLTPLEVEKPIKEETPVKEKTPQKILQDVKKSIEKNTTIEPVVKPTVTKIVEKKILKKPVPEKNRAVGVFEIIALIIVVALIFIIIILKRKNDKLKDEMQNISNQVNTKRADCKKDLDEVVKKYDNELAITHRKIHEQGEFFASMSHEIRTPMNAIIGMSQILTEDKTLTQTQYDTINTIHRSSNMLLGIINDILDFSKIEAGKLTLEKTPFDLNIILNYLADMVSIKVQEKGLKFAFDIDHNIGKNYLGDPLRLSQILLNLISNSVKFTQRGAITLNITTIDPSPANDGKAGILFEVMDTGIGMSEKQLANLFQSYSQASEDTSRKYGGTGLGLTISKQLAEMMNGRIWAESEVDHGTSFFVEVYLDLDDNNLRKYRLPSKKIMDWKVLIIDSHKRSIKSLENLLNYFHLEVLSTTDTTLVAQLLEFEKYDLVFVDENMLELLDLEKLKREHTLKIVLIEEWMNSLRSDRRNHPLYDEILKRPFTQQMIFDILSNIHHKLSHPEENLSLHREKQGKIEKEEIIALKKHDILVAEDNKINQKVLLGIFSNTNLELTIANDGQEAIEKIETSAKPFDLILMDINMPNVDGYMATKIIRQNIAYAKTPIIGLSGHVSAEDKQKALDTGMQDYLLKPIDIQALYGVLLKYLS